MEKNNLGGVHEEHKERCGQASLLVDERFAESQPSGLPSSQTSHNLVSQPFTLPVNPDFVISASSHRIPLPRSATSTTIVGSLNSTLVNSAEQNFVPGGMKVPSYETSSATGSASQEASDQKTFAAVACHVKEEKIFEPSTHVSKQQANATSNNHFSEVINTGALISVKDEQILDESIANPGRSASAPVILQSQEVDDHAYISDYSAFSNHLGAASNATHKLPCDTFRAFLEATEENETTPMPLDYTFQSHTSDQSVEDSHSSFYPNFQIAGHHNMPVSGDTQAHYESAITTATDHSYVGTEYAKPTYHYHAVPVSVSPNQQTASTITSASEMSLPEMASLLSSSIGSLQTSHPILQYNLSESSMYSSENQTSSSLETAEDVTDAAQGNVMQYPIISQLVMPGTSDAGYSDTQYAEYYVSQYVSHADYSTCDTYYPEAPGETSEAYKSDPQHKVQYITTVDVESPETQESYLRQLEDSEKKTASKVAEAKEIESIAKTLASSAPPSSNRLSSACLSFEMKQEPDEKTDTLSTPNPPGTLDPHLNVSSVDQRSTPLPHVGTLVQPNSLKNKVVFLTPDSITASNTLPRFSSFRKIRQQQIGESVNDYFLSIFPSEQKRSNADQVVLKLEQVQPNVEPRHQRQGQDTNQATSDGTSAKENLKKAPKVEEVKDGSVVSRAESKQELVQESPKLASQTQSQNKTAPRPERKMHHLVTNRLSSAEGSKSANVQTQAKGGTGKKKVKRQRSADSSSKGTSEKPKRPEIVTCDADSTQTDDPVTSANASHVSPMTIERQAKGLFMHLPTKFQASRSSEEDSNEISSTVDEDHILRMNVEDAPEWSANVEKKALTPRKIQPASARRRADAPVPPKLSPIRIGANHSSVMSVSYGSSLSQGSSESLGSALGHGSAVWCESSTSPGSFVPSGSSAPHAGTSGITDIIEVDVSTNNALQRTPPSPKTTFKTHKQKLSEPALCNTNKSGSLNLCRPSLEALVPARDSTYRTASSPCRPLSDGDSLPVCDGTKQRDGTKQVSTNICNHSLEKAPLSVCDMSKGVDAGSSFSSVSSIDLPKPDEVSSGVTDSVEKGLETEVRTKSEMSGGRIEDLSTRAADYSKVNLPKTEGLQEEESIGPSSRSDVPYMEGNRSHASQSDVLPTRDKAVADGTGSSVGRSQDHSSLVRSKDEVASDPENCKEANKEVLPYPGHQECIEEVYIRKKNGGATLPLKKSIVTEHKTPPKKRGRLPKVSPIAVDDSKVCKSSVEAGGDREASSEPKGKQRSSLPQKRNLVPEEDEVGKKSPQLSRRSLRKRTTEYNTDEKKAAVKMVESCGLIGASRKLGIQITTLSKWTEAAEEQSEDENRSELKSESTTACDVSDLPQIQKKFPRVRQQEVKPDSESKSESGVGSDVFDGPLKEHVGQRIEKVAEERVAEENVARDGAVEQSKKTGAKSIGPEDNQPKRRGRKRKLDTQGDDDSSKEVVKEKRKRGRPAKPKDQVEDNPGRVIPDSDIPPWVVTKSTQGKYNSYNYQQKEDLLELAGKYGVCAVASKLGIPVSTISCWRRTFKKDTRRDPLTGRKIGSGRKVCYGDEVDELILQWILERCDLHCSTTVDDICSHAASLIKTLEGCHEFKASHGWAAKFRHRHVMMFDGRTPLSQKLPPKLELFIEHFQRQIHEIRQEYTILPSLIINVDEISIYFDLTGRKMKLSEASKKKNKQEVVIRTTVGRKQHVTLLGAVTAEGRGLRPMLVVKGKADSAPETTEECVIGATDRGHVDQATMVQWIQRVLLPYTHGRTCLLVIDSYEPHRVKFVMELFSRYNVIVALIPEGCNSKLQPMSVVVSKLLRLHLKESWFYTVQEPVSKLANTPSSRLTHSETQAVTEWVADSWENVCKENTDLITKSFKACGISNAVDGSEASLIRNNAYLDVPQLCPEQEHDHAHGFFY